MGKSCRLKIKDIICHALQQQRKDIKLTNGMVRSITLHKVPEDLSLVTSISNTTSHASTKTHMRTVIGDQGVIRYLNR